MSQLWSSWLGVHFARRCQHLEVMD
ncbi:MAG: hypothetical protein JWM45_2877, partial [Pseudonocardiales bacterium]|nr:hypothetical protein [Pseudonocardiales bacterium]